MFVYHVDTENSYMLQQPRWQGSVSVGLRVPSGEASGIIRSQKTLETVEGNMHI